MAKKKQYAFIGAGLVAFAYTIALVASSWLFVDTKPHVHLGMCAFAALFAVCGIYLLLRSRLAAKVMLAAEMAVLIWGTANIGWPIAFAALFLYPAFLFPAYRCIRIDEAPDRLPL